MGERFCVNNYNDILFMGRERAGNKAYNLAHLNSLCKEISIPISLCLLVHDKEERKQALIELRDLIAQQFKYPVILRSSSTIEDTKISCAGIFLSDICNTENELFDVVERVLCSADSDNVKMYCTKLGIDYTSIKMAVLVQEYRIPTASGVIFTKEPLTNNDNVVCVEYIKNTSDAVTAGTKKSTHLELIKSGTHNHDPTFEKQLLDIALSIEGIWRQPVDIEWIMYGEEIQVVQVRPITT